jgi:RNA polymerase sigma-70 factor (ECF subfamily)
MSFILFIEKVISCIHPIAMLTTSLSILCLQIAEQDDELAFGEIFKLYYPKLVVFAAAICKNTASAEEVVEDVFLKLWENRKTLPAINNLNYYLLVATKHKSLDYLEKMKKQASVSLDHIEVEFGVMHINPESTLISAETVHIIQSIIEDLPQRCKLIFRLVKEDGLKYREVAELLNISIKTVETQMSLALSKIGTALQNSLPSDHKLYTSTKKKSL